MQITRLRVSGFKSFGEPVELLIESGLTGVVGPNGCGKSNIVEALRWVMGESSARGLRGDEMDDVIFSGSAGRAAFDVAEVTLRLRGPLMGTTSLAPTAADEVDVGRRLSRGVGSLYRINGAEARARDVQLLFSDAGAGTRSASIIGQGQIGFIVDSKPQERRRLLEEAAGIGGLHGRRREAESRLEATGANLDRVNDRLAELERRAGELAKQAREAQRYRKLGEELRLAEALWLLGRWQAAAGALAEAEAAGRAAAAAFDEAGRQVETLRQERAVLARRLEEASAESARLATEVARIGERLSARRGEHESRLAQRRALEQRAGEIASDRSGEAAARGELAARVELAEAEAEALAGRMPALEAALQDAVERERLAAASAQEAEAALPGAVAALAEAEAAARSAEAQRQRLATRRTEIERGLAATPEPGEPAADEGVGGADGQIAALAEALARSEGELEAAQARRDALQPLLAEAEAALSAAREQATLALSRRQAGEADARLAEQRQSSLARERSRVEAEAGRIEAGRASHAAALAALDLDSARRATDGARAAAEAAGAERVRVGKLLGEAEQALAAVAPRLQSGRERLASLQAEERAIQALLPESSTGAMVDAVTVDDGFAEALGAALGDDLLAGDAADEAVYWRDLQAPSPELPPLPEGCTALDRHVRAPGLLHRRLGQIGVVEPGLAETLQPSLRPGQRLVSRDGGSWRWDGLVRRPGGADAAAIRLRQRQRLAELALAREAAEAEAAVLAAEHAAAGDALQAARARADAAQAAAGAAQAAAEAVARRLAAAESESGVLARQAAELGEATDRLGEARRALAREEAAMPAAAPGSLAELVEAAAAAERTRATAQRRLVEVQAERDAAERAHAGLAARVRDARQRLEAARGVEARRRDEAERAARIAAERRAAARTTRAALTAEMETVTGELAGVEAEAVQAAAFHDDRRKVRQAAEAAVEVARTAHRQAATARADRRGELAAAVGRAAQLDALLAETRQRIDGHDQRLAELSQRGDRIAEELAGLPDGDADGMLEALSRQHAELQRDSEAAASARAAAEAELAETEGRLAAADEQRSAAQTAGALAQADRARGESAVEAAAAAVRERLQAEPDDLAADPEIAQELGKSTVAEREARLARLRASRERLGLVNLRAEVEHAEVEEQLATARSEAEELAAAVERLKRAVSTLNREGRERLTAAFTAVDEHFRRLFARLFGGGRAHLRLTDMEDPFSAGLELEASPPGKKLTSVSLLSGGEKTLTALALVFALFLTQPSPLCVLDEVDAPLDDANVDRFISLMQEIGEQAGTRFIVVTHHPLTMSRMDRLYGVTMIERGVSRLVSVALEEAVELRATA